MFDEFLENSAHFQVNRENKTGGVPGGVATGLVAGGQQSIPIIVKRCVEEVERRGLDIIGILFTFVQTHKFMIIYC